MSLFELIKQVQVVHKGKNAPITIQRIDSRFCFSPNDDADFWGYLKAKSYLSAYPRLVKALEKIGYI